MGVLPLAFISKTDKRGVKELVRKAEAYLNAKAPERTKSEIWTAIDVLMGLRYDQSFVKRVLKGVTGMEESVTYRAIVEKGREEGLVEEARKILVELGTEKLGRPSKKDLERIKSIESRSALEALVKRVLRAASWRELL